MTSVEIRQQFLDFFQSKGHTIVPSAPIVVKNDPTLMFTNAGMNQFKDYFLGNRKPAYPRVADTQKCLRVSGKHNDLEEVGVDTYHHTMFEMLGNWSFGDYFKKEAIAWSWELLTSVYKIPADRLYVTVFEGDPKESLPMDEESFQEWKNVIAPDRILMGSKKDNFWEMGDTGPCGPCTEIHVDCRPDAERKKIAGKTLVNADHPQVIEIWNNVFIQFNRVWSDKKSFDDWNAANPSAPKEEKSQKILESTKLEGLPQKHVDTGMGLERLVRILQGKNSNYDTDIFSGIITEVAKITGKKYGAGDSKPDIAFRVLADHIRAISFTIADGQLPSNTGAGYVIRRILRRAVRYYYSYLDHKQPLLHLLVPGLADQFAHVFPELVKQQEFVTKVIREEEEAFLRTLEKGLKRIHDMVGSAATVADKTIKGGDAFELYDTYGFPVDLTRLIASENNLQVDEKGFEAEMQKQKERSRAATSLDTGDWTVLDDYARNEFVGYDSLEAETKIARYRKVKAKNKESYQLVLEVTPFYAESGGQVGDTGFLKVGSQQITVTNTKKENDLIIHFTDTLPSDPGSAVLAVVDAGRRKQIVLHHTATHLLHASLRQVLGKHVAQKGSLVNEEHLRFDFSHFSKVTEEEITAIEKMVNDRIRENIPVVIKEMPKEEALAMGAMALFGEKYGERVRVVIIDPAYSVELCGGTHVAATGELGFFKIKGESAVAAGVRRIEAVSGTRAEEYVGGQLDLLGSVKEHLKQPPDIVKSIDSLLAENTDLKKRLDHLENRILVGVRNELLTKDEIINGVTFIGEIIEVGNADALKKICFDLKNNLHDYLVVLCANIGGKPAVAIGMADTVVAAKGLDAGKMIKEKVAPLIKGGGGGQKNLATAGGQDPSQLAKVIAEVKALL